MSSADLKPFPVHPEDLAVQKLAEALDRAGGYCRNVRIAPEPYIVSIVIPTN